MDEKTTATTVSPPSTRRWRNVLIWLAIIVTAIAWVYFGPVGEEFRIYQSMSTRWEKRFPAGRGNQPADVEFVVRGCEPPGAVPRTNSSNAMEWLPDGRAVVRQALSTSCNAPFDAGNYTVQGDALTLTYRINWPDDRRLACLCGYELEYRISNLPQKNYSVTIRDLANR